MRRARRGEGMRTLSMSSAIEAVFAVAVINTQAQSNDCRWLHLFPSVPIYYCYQQQAIKILICSNVLPMFNEPSAHFGTLTDGTSFLLPVMRLILFASCFPFLFLSPSLTDCRSFGIDWLWMFCAGKCPLAEDGHFDWVIIALSTYITTAMHYCLCTTPPTFYWPP